VRAFFRTPTVQGIACMLRQPVALAEARVVPVQPHGSRTPFYCVGGDWPVFRALARRLGPDQPFFGVPIPGRKELPSPYGLEDFAAVCVQTIRAAQPEGPYCVGGWSDWGVLGYEIARQLMQGGSDVTLLALFDSESPGQSMNLSPAQLALGQLRARTEWLKFHARAIPRLQFSEAKRYVGTGLRNRISGLQTAMHAIKDLRTRGGHGQSDVEDAAQALQLAVVKYRPQPYAGRTILFRAAKPPGHYRDPQSGWRELIEELEIHNVPGGHLDILLEPAVQIVADKLGSGLIEGKKMQVAGALGWISRRPAEYAAGS
jgi:thioesterase domain-containing protein